MTTCVCFGACEMVGEELWWCLRRVVGLLIEDKRCDRDRGGSGGCVFCFAALMCEKRENDEFVWCLVFTADLGHLEYCVVRRVRRLIK